MGLIRGLGPPWDTLCPWLDGGQGADPEDRWLGWNPTTDCVPWGTWLVLLVPHFLTHLQGKAKSPLPGSVVGAQWVCGSQGRASIWKPVGSERPSC